MSVKLWDTEFKAPVRGLFFGNLNASRTVPEGKANRMQLLDTLSPQVKDPISLPYQTHSAVCHYISDYTEGQEGDALVTDKPALPLGVLTADCAPVLFQGIKADGSPVIGAAHAGARGAARGILVATIAMMRDKGALDIKAAIGPCIHKESYEVGTDFQDELIAEDHLSYAFFTPKGEEKFFFDLPAYVQSLLQRENVPYAFIDMDTYSSPDCFSYRRSTHKGEADYGRQLSAIVILP